MKWLRLQSLFAKPQQESTALVAQPDPQLITEQINPNLFATDNTAYVGGTEEDYYWRSLSDSYSQKDLLPSTYLEMHNLIYEAWQTNPLAHAIIEITTSFVLGRGVTITANNKRVQAVLRNFWDHPQNNMDERIYLMCQELALYGEIFVRFFVNRYEGSVTIRMIDPSLIDIIETDPEDIETVLRFHRRAVAPPVDQPQRFSRIDTATPNIDGEWLRAHDEVMQFAINKVSSAKRGNSDLTTILPWLRRYKDWLTDRVRINKYKGAFLWDVKLMGADKKLIDKKRMEYAFPPEPGSVLIHNEAEEWKAVQPQINANDAKEDGRAIKMMVAAGVTLPEHFLSDGHNANRATAAEMGLPTLLKFQRRQKTLRNMLRRILDRVIQEAQQAGKLGKTINTSYDIVLPEIDVQDNQSLATALEHTVNALSVAKSQSWVSDETAMKLMFKSAAEEIDVHEEREKITKDTQDTQKGGGSPSLSSMMNDGPDKDSDQFSQDQG